MGREVKRVPLEFDWPLGEVWDGYLMPKRLRERKCDDCENGYSPQAESLFKKWYGYVPFDPSETGSPRLTPDTPEVRAFAERNVSNSPDYYGVGETAVVTEARRLATMWNGMWSHHLEQADVDALVAGGRLMDFTHTWSREDRWQPRDPMPVITAAEVNTWAIGSMGHDSINAGVVIRARCAREDWPEVCPTCLGHASVERWPGQRDAAEAWEHSEPPTGDGWQMWETTSEGSPSTPVFATPEALADYCAIHCTTFGSHKATAAEWLKIITGEDFAHVVIAPGVIAM